MVQESQIEPELSVDLLEVMTAQTCSHDERETSPRKELGMIESIENVRLPEVLNGQTVDPSPHDMYVRDQSSLNRQERDVNNPQVGVGPRHVVVPESRREKVMRKAVIRGRMSKVKRGRMSFVGVSSQRIVIDLPKLLSFFRSYFSKGDDLSPTWCFESCGHESTGVGIEEIDPG